MLERILLQGKDESKESHLATATSGFVVACLSVGSGAESPGRLHKGDPRFPNEDALLVLRDGIRFLFAIADGHHGISMSHTLTEELGKLDAIPAHIGQLALWLSTLDLENSRSGSTLLVALGDERTGSVSGLSFGDSSAMVLSDQEVSVVNSHNRLYLRGGTSTPIESASPFQIQVLPGEGLLLCSDGITECCYGNPDASVQAHHIKELWSSHLELEDFANRLCQTALQGVDGNPGGQDNISLIVWKRR